MTNQRKETVLVVSLILLIAVFLSALLFVAAKLSSTSSKPGAAYHCPAENKAAMSRFIYNCTGVHSEAYCYALAKSEFC